MGLEPKIIVSLRNRMNKETTIKLFDQKQIRSTWDEEQEKWHFSIIGAIEALTGTDRLTGTYLGKGYSKEWTNQRLKSIEIRKELTWHKLTLETK